MHNGSVAVDENRRGGGRGEGLIYKGGRYNIFRPRLLHEASQLDAHLDGLLGEVSPAPGAYARPLFGST